MKPELKTLLHDPSTSPIAELLADHAKLTHALAQASPASEKQDHILLLLQADLRNYRLFYGLQQASFITEYFHTHLEKVVLPMMGFTSDQLLHDHQLVPFYFSLLDEAMQESLPDFLRRLPELAAEMYGELVYFRMEISR